MYRPWGHIDWALSLAKIEAWSFIGCLGPEERSVCAAIELSKRKRLKNSLLFCIEEPDSPSFAAAKMAIEKRKQQLANQKVDCALDSRILLDPVQGCLPSLNSALSESVILDISSFPKRYFFYLIKKIRSNEGIKNFVIIYTSPSQYAAGPLSGDEEPWDILPTFRPTDPDIEGRAKRRLIVNVGFMPDGLIAHLGGPIGETKIDLIIPFPAPMTSLQRSWQSVWALTSAPSTTAKITFNEVRVASNDMSSAFQRILTLVPEDTNHVSFAPFGPKPISAAMCMYASSTGSPVYYSQPKFYDPTYSSGVRTVDGKLDIMAYWVKHGGRDFYELPEERMVQI